MACLNHIIEKNDRLGAFGGQAPWGITAGAQYNCAPVLDIPTPTGSQLHCDSVHT